jgi:hypothetical protein
MNMLLVSRRTHLASMILAAASALAGCSGGQARPSSVLKPIEERRARGLIEQALSDNGMRPKQGRVVDLPGGTKLVEEMAIDGEVYGVAYVTAQEAAQLGDAVPAYQADNDQLRLVQGSGGAIVLVLYEQNYRYDAGDEHSTNIITAEKKLSRDVSDFVVHVVKQRKSQ